MLYRVTFVDHGGRAFSTSQLEAQTNDEAVSLARRIYSRGLGAAFQIWNGQSLIHTEWFGSQVAYAS